MSYVILTAFLAAGFIVGRLIRLPGWAKKATSWALTACLFGIVFLLGLKLGGNEALASQAGSIGVKALALACGSVLGSVLLVKCYAMIRNMPKQGRRG
jgi:hypothetical protein